MAVLIPFNTKAISYPVDEQTKQVINQETKNGIELTISGALIILTILFIYKKNRIKL